MGRTVVSSTSQRWRGVHLMSPFTLTTAKLVALYVRRPVLAESTVAGDQTHALRVPPSFTKVSWRRLITATTAAAPITYACTRNRSGHRDTTTVTRTATFSTEQNTRTREPSTRITTRTRHVPCASITQR